MEGIGPSIFAVSKLVPGIAKLVPEVGRNGVDVADLPDAHHSTLQLVWYRDKGIAGIAADDAEDEVPHLGALPRSGAILLPGESQWGALRAVGFPDIGVEHVAHRASLFS